jgi:1-acyl-sn-glycerol-3-phosphate acyltransferase
MDLWQPTAPCTPRRCLTTGTPTVGPLHRLARYAAVVAVLLTGVVLSPIGGRFAPARRDRLITTWMRALVTALGVRVRITGPAAGFGSPPAGRLVVANHISWLDIPLVAAVRPGRNLAKSEIASWPVLGSLAPRGGTFFVDRSRPRALPGTVAEIATALRAGSAVVVFPEGSTWCGKGQGRFRNAMFQAALDAGVPVQPVAIRYRFTGAEPTTVPSFIGEETLFASLRRVVAARGLVAEVSLRAPIPPGAHQDRRSLARAAQAAVEPGTGRRPARGLVGVVPECHEPAAPGAPRGRGLEGVVPVRGMAP